MSDRRKKGTSDEVNDALGFLSKLALGVAAGALVGGAGAIYLAIKEGEESEKQNEQEQGPSQSPEKNKIVIAVDATPNQAGGFLWLPNTKQIYFYSVDWTKYFDFTGINTQPDVFEIANARLALLVFNQYVRKHNVGGLKQNQELICKTDNNVVIRLSGSKRYHGTDPTKLFQQFTSDKLQASPFYGTWEHVLIAQDVDMRIADILSRKDYHSKEFLPDVPDTPYEGCDMTNVSENAVSYLPTLAEEIRYKFRK